LASGAARSRSSNKHITQGTAHTRQQALRCQHSTQQPTRLSTACNMHQQQQQPLGIGTASNSPQGVAQCRTFIRKAAYAALLPKDSSRTGLCTHLSCTSPQLCHCSWCRLARLCTCTGLQCTLQAGRICHHIWEERTLQGRNTRAAATTDLRAMVGVSVAACSLRGYN
jgi:hypothetical protein